MPQPVLLLYSLYEPAALFNPLIYWYWLKCLLNRFDTGIDFFSSVPSYVSREKEGRGVFFTLQQSFLILMKQYLVQSKADIMR